MASLRRHGDQWKLDEKLPKAEVHSTLEPGTFPTHHQLLVAG